ncbi:MAG: roadblock/LC7 domain-containing protein [Chloroflexi bacterium]|nr:roadblock/LC7 domain-containing protein [Chloroflexota bacterium]
MEASLSNLILTPSSIAAIEARIGQLVGEAGAQYALLTDTSGQLICRQGEPSGLDVVAFGALLAANFAASRQIARMLHEYRFRMTLQQGERSNVLTTLVGERCVLSVGFTAGTQLGLVKYLTAQASADLARSIAEGDEVGAETAMPLADFQATAIRTIEALFREAGSSEPDELWRS